MAKLAAKNQSSTASTSSVVTPKPPLIFIHGFRGAPLGLKTIADKLALEGYPVFTPAIPPFAGATPLPEYTPKSYAKFIRDYITENEISRPILIGHSMGSIIASATAEHYPKLLSEKLILLSPISARPVSFIRQISPLSAYLPKRLVDYVTTKYLFVPNETELFKQVLQITHACSFEQPPRPKAVRAAAKFSSSYTITDFSPRKEIYLIAGESDRLISQDTTKVAADKLHAQLTFIPMTGHLHNYEKPLETAAIIQKIIEN